MTDLLDDFVRARMEPIRDQLWAHGEITATGLRRLDKALGIDTYSRGNETANQCDGCRRGLPLDEHGIHWGKGYDMIGCTAERYTEASE